MADSTPAPETTAADHNSVTDKPDPESRPTQPDPSSTSPHPFPNPNPSGPPPPSLVAPPPSLVAPPPSTIQPSFRPAGAPVPVPSSAVTPQFSPVLYQTPGVPPPGVLPTPVVGSIPLASHHPMMVPPYAVAGQPMRYGPPMSNGYPGMPQPLPQGAMPPGGFFSLFPMSCPSLDL